MSKETKNMSDTVRVNLEENSKYRVAFELLKEMGGPIPYKSAPRPFDIGPASPEKLHFTTYVLGGLLVHAFSSTNAAASLRLRRRFGPSAMILGPSNLLQIWPTSLNLISWPSSPLLGDTEVDALVNAGPLGIQSTGRV
jgi:hypothetical protein